MRNQSQLYIVKTWLKTSDERTDLFTIRRHACSWNSAQRIILKQTLSVITFCAKGNLGNYMLKCFPELKSSSENCAQFFGLLIRDSNSNIKQLRKFKPVALEYSDVKRSFLSKFSLYAIALTFNLIKHLECANFQLPTCTCENFKPMWLFACYRRR